MESVFAPGCALMLYKPHLSVRILDFLNAGSDSVKEHMICCRHEPKLPVGTRIINTCAGCDKRFRELYPGIGTISLWEVLADSGTFPFPDYNGAAMTILDACPTRDQDRVHTAIRTLLTKMNIRVIEPEKTGRKGACCGDSLYGAAPLEQVKERMKKRAGEMPVDDVAVYCVSCCKPMHIGRKRPRYMVDLLFGEDTEIGVFEPDEWHGELEKYIAGH